MKRSKRKRMQRAEKTLYDDLYYNQKDPKAANLALLVFETERLHETEGVIPCFRNFKASKAQLNEFMTRNQGALTQLFNEHFPDPEAYCFGKFRMEFKNKGDC